MMPKVSLNTTKCKKKCSQIVNNRLLIHLGKLQVDNFNYFTLDNTSCLVPWENELKDLVECLPFNETLRKD